MAGPRIPRILLSPWRQNLPTQVHANEDLITLGVAYVDAVRRAGGVPLLAPHSLDDDEVDSLLAVVDGVVITGGDDIDPAAYGALDEASIGVRPEADVADLRLLSAAFDRGLPVLGVCRGLQIANVFFGGDLIQEARSDDDSEHPMVDPATNHAHLHTIDIALGSRLSMIYEASSLEVGSLHHQAIGRLGEGLVATAHTRGGVVEAVEARHHDLLAVQWHPELGAVGDALFVDVVDRAR